MATTTTGGPHGGSRTAGVLHTARSRGALSGLLVLVLGLWAAFVPFVGPYFGYAFGPATPWFFSGARFWLQLLPGAVLVACGLILSLTANRVSAMVGGWLAAAAGAWLVVGTALWSLATANPTPVGPPVGPPRLQAVEQIGMFTGLGAVVMLLAGLAVGRFSVRGVRDIHAAERASQRREERRQDRRAASSSGTAQTSEEWTQSEDGAPDQRSGEESGTESGSTASAEGNTQRRVR